jgi:HPt (histidine-containing phosphotransfer) domain-containing protein
MRAAVLSSDRAQVMAEAHHIKGSSSNVGALQIRDLVVKVEHLETAELNAVLQIIDDIGETLNPLQLLILDKISLQNS